jgi:chorismate dehydratase
VKYLIIFLINPIPLPSLYKEYQSENTIEELIKTEDLAVLTRIGCNFKVFETEKMSEKIRISAVQYANTYPFIWGLKESGFEKKVALATDHPAQCAAKLRDGRADIGLIPVAAIPEVKNSSIISDYCIGTNGKVRTVMLLSNCPFNELDTVNLDYRSVTSVNLVKILAAGMWKKEFRWNDTSEKTDFLSIACNEAVVLIGDQCFESESKYKFRIDLAEEWKNHTGLPFVFACWVANREIDESFRGEFNDALSMGVNNIEKVAEYFGNSGKIGREELEKYLKENIDYHLDARKKEAMNLFHSLMQKL